MRNFILVLCFCFVIPQAFAYSTQASKFAEKEYYKQHKYKVHINSKKEHTLEYKDFVGEQFVHIIKYGWGDMKVKGYKKCRVTYTVLFDFNDKPFWSSIYSSQQ